MTYAVILPKGEREPSLRRIAMMVASLDANKSWRVEAREHRDTRSLEQNAYLWGVIYPTIIERAALDGWTNDDLHEYLLGEHFGWERLDGLGRPRVRPIRRSARLSIQDFSDYIEFVQRFAAERGIVIPEPA